MTTQVGIVGAAECDLGGAQIHPRTAAVVSAQPPMMALLLGEVDFAGELGMTPDDDETEPLAVRTSGNLVDPAVIGGTENTRALARWSMP